jgi:phosphoserine phosphatase
MPKQPRALVVDIDGTLWSSNSWLELTKGLGADVNKHTRIFSEYKNGRISYPESKTQLIGLWQGTGNANKPFVTKLLKSWKLDARSYDLINLLKSRGFKTSIITSSFDLWAGEVSSTLNTDEFYYNTKTLWDDNNELIDYDYNLDQTGKKLSQFNSFCHKYDLKPEDCLVIGDGENDIELFKITGNGVLVGDNQNKELNKASCFNYSDIGSFLKSKELESILA